MTYPKNRVWLGVVSALMMSSHAVNLHAQETQTQSTQPQIEENATEEEMVEIIEVAGRRGAIQNANELERMADEFKSIVTSDDIGQFGDPTVAESLQRIAGVSINRSGGEGQQVSVRGLPTQFATVTLDGARLGSSDPELNSTNLDIFSADNLSSIEVIKVLLPEMDADAIAGAINLNTISAIARGKDSYGFRVESAYQEKAEAWNPKLSADFTKLVDLDSGRLGFAGGITYQDRETITDEASIGDGLNYFTVEEYEDDGELVREYFQGGDVDDCTDTQEDGRIVECYLIPQELDLRSEEETRERLSLNGQIEYQTDNHLFQVRGSYSDNKETFYTNRATYDFSRSDGDLPMGLGTDDPDVDEVVEIGVDANGAVFGTFEDARSERRLRPGVEDEKVWTLGLEGTSTLGDNWELNYGADFSRNEVEQDRSEARFRSDNISMTFANLNDSGIDIDLAREFYDDDDDDLDPTTGEGFPIRAETFDGELLGTPNRTFDSSIDKFSTYYFDAKRWIEVMDTDVELKFGVKHRTREREFDFSRVEYLVDADIRMADFPNKAFADRSDFPIPIDIERNDLLPVLNELIANGRVATVAERGDFITLADLQDDFTAEEDVTAAYIQFKFEPVEDLQIITGVRMEDTEYTTTGSSVRQQSFDTGITDTLAQALANGGVDEDEIDAFISSRQSPAPLIEQRTGGNDYRNWFPHLSMKWEVTETVQVRASYTEGIKRPEYGEAAAIQFLDTNELLDDDILCSVVVSQFGGTGSTEECPLEAEDFAGILSSIEEAEAALAIANEEDNGPAFRTEAGPARNPFLEPLTSQNFDASISWFPSESVAFTVAAFHKSIDNFIVPIVLTGDDVTRLGFEVDDGTATSFGISEIDTVANGDEAEIQGLEISYYQAYTFLPGILSNLYVQANATFADSSASSDLVDRDFQFPDQSDAIGNFSIGWEDEVFSIRTAIVYQGERLRAINEAGLEDDDPAGDLIEDARTQVDINVRYNITEEIQVYLDAININDAEDNRLFRGGAAGILNNGNYFATLENYGPTYQLGIRGRF
uniref:TonB-dependent receptor n=1 Tax=Ningiella ruwaisensis TaxID=2364274 RepID=UPI00109F9143|nr:TonB-dependent receptor [Ningiella ruwaisensis]